MGRPKTILTDKEARILDHIPAAKIAILLWADLRRKTQAAKAQRTLFAKALIKVNHQLAKHGPTGLWARWLRVNSIPYDWAYDLMARVPGSGFTPKSARPSAVRRRRVFAYLTAIRKVDQKAKHLIFGQLCAYIKREWGIR